ncbi:MAG: serine/threonine-protein kinase [Cyanobacteria bacterium J06635_1]
MIKQFFPDSQNGQCDSPEERLHPNASDAPGAMCASAALSVRKANELFQQEAVQLKQLGHHPQIPALLDVFEEATHQYMIQELIEGENLEGFLKISDLFTEEQIFNLLKSLLPVLEFIHQNKVIHRDIKPANIVYKNVDGLPYLVDLGAAKHATGTALVRASTVIGSAEYTSPEQARGRPIFASDIYSLGVTCIYLLTGISPFNLYDTGESCWVWRDFLKQPIQPDLARILDKMIQMSTNRRYQSVAAVKSDLSSVDLQRISGSLARATAGKPPSVLSRSPLVVASHTSETDFDRQVFVLNALKPPSQPKRAQLSRHMLRAQPFKPQGQPRSNLGRTMVVFSLLTLIVGAKVLIDKMLFPPGISNRPLEALELVPVLPCQDSASERKC